jgi:hypothetical protein
VSRSAENSCLSISGKEINRELTRIAKALALIGRHPTPILILPSLWFLLRYLPFWKDIDATVQLIAPVYDDNLLHFPPVYSFLARIPFLVIDSILGGHAPGIFERQHPSLVAVYGLVVLQHAGLWIALRYFLFSFPARDIARGAIALLLASIASFYSFAHTCGSESITAVTYLLVFGAGIRALLNSADWRLWTIYIAALFLAVGARHINVLLLLWLPGTAVALVIWSFISRSSFPTTVQSRRSRILLAVSASLCSLAAFGAEKIVLGGLCRQFGVVERSSLGSALSDRIATWVDPLPSDKKRALMEHLQPLTTDPLVKQAIQSQIEIGSYDKGTREALTAALQARGLEGERLLVVRDELISQSSLLFYRTFDSGLMKAIAGDFWHGFVPTNDQGIAIAAPKATFFSLDRIKQNPSDWVGVSELPIFLPATAEATLQRATGDNVIRHWRWMPILAWTLLFLGVGGYRAIRGHLSGTQLFVGLSILGIGTLVYAATCASIYAVPRYALPLLASVMAFGCLACAASSAAGISATAQTARRTP